MHLHTSKKGSKVHGHFNGMKIDAIQIQMLYLLTKAPIMSRIINTMKSNTKIDQTSVKLMSHLRKLTKLTKWKSDKN